MSTEKINAATAVTDEELDKVTGGYTSYHDHATDAYYLWQGGPTDNSKYLCPNCKRPVHYGSWLRYFCDPCDASWLNEGRLLPNLNERQWKRVTKQEYEDQQNNRPGVEIH